MSKYLITGGAGFIGCNLASTLLQKGHEVVIFDNLSRKGTDLNIKWLRTRGRLTLIKGDLRNFDDIRKAFRKTGPVDTVAHLAAQVAVTTSVTNPREDFEINALGTFNLLEAVRQSGGDPVVLFASTNKVYGGMEDIAIVERKGRYQYRDFPDGISEDRLLDFHSPYGCSKGAADQYMHDYARIYGLRTVVFRQSCIYGYRQFGVEDQGWVAWFIIASVLGRPVTVYGDGKQVRDVLFIDDLVNAYLTAERKIKKTAGRVFNIGGGAHNQMSLLELIAFLEEQLGRKLDYSFADWRPGDQPVFVCDVSKAQREFGWKPRTPVNKGVKKLFDWVVENKTLFEKIF
jgi:CDP-paratose 2-epimerase